MAEVRNWFQAQHANMQGLKQRVVGPNLMTTKWSTLLTENQALRQQLHRSHSTIRELAQIETHDSLLIRKLSKQLESVLLDNVQLRQDRNQAQTDLLQAQGVENIDQCVVCMEATRSHALVPCGHYVFCATCAAESMARQQPCPCCRQPAEQAIRIYYG